MPFAPSQRDLDWMAGLLEGEGMFGWAPLRGGSDKKIPLIQLIMNDRDVVERYAAIVDNSVGIKKRAAPRAQGYRVRTAGARAVEIMIALHPLMGERRRGKIEEILTDYGQAGVEAWNAKTKSVSAPAR